jgi:serine/threonine protein kinase
MNSQYKTSYEREITILREMNKIKTPGFLKFLDCGFDHPNNSYYIVTELLGSDIHRLMSKCEGKKFRIETAIRIGLQMFLRIR